MSAPGWQTATTGNWNGMAGRNTEGGAFGESFSHALSIGR